MFEQAFKNIDDVLWKEAGCTTELDYTEQTSWLLFLKYLDGLEQDLAAAAALEGRPYAFILDEPYRWESWAAPKGADGKLDHNRALTGDDLRDFVNGKLFPYLHGFKERATSSATIEYKIGEIFGEIKNKISSGYNMREIIDHIDELRFRSQAEKHELSHLYEAKIRNMGNAGRNGGEYYTPRPLIRAIVRVVAPKLGETIYDGAAGSAGFLCEAYDYLKATYPERTTAQDRALQQSTFYGKEKKSLAYVIRRGRGDPARVCGIPEVAVSAAGGGVAQLTAGRSGLWAIQTREDWPRMHLRRNRATGQSRTRVLFREAQGRPPSPSRLTSSTQAQLSQIRRDKVQERQRLPRMSEPSSWPPPFPSFPLPRRTRSRLPHQSRCCRP